MEGSAYSIGSDYHVDWQVQMRVRVKGTSQSSMTSAASMSHMMSQIGMTNLGIARRSQEDVSITLRNMVIAESYKGALH